ncbi:MAG: hypothetical protein IT452_08500 [Planctomycetia bacterium]|nr:hypothetical protein [Planctomycetia bacterium]
MNRTAKIALVAAALLLAVALRFAMFRRGAPEPADPGAGGVPADGRPVGASGSDPAGTPAGGSGFGTGTTGTSPQDPGRTPLTVQQETQAKSLKRMGSIGRAWLDGLAARAAMPESQRDEIWLVVEEFIRAFEALRWRREVEEDVETTIERLYAAADARIRALLGAGQQDAFRGLPRDWGFSLQDPGPIRPR